MTPSIDQALHQFLTLLLIWTLLPNLTFCLIARGFHRTFATSAACQQRTLTPPDTWSCPTLGLAIVLMLRPISPELVLFPDLWVFNIPRYFCYFFRAQEPKAPVTYCDHALSGVRRPSSVVCRPSSVVRRLSSVRLFTFSTSSPEPLDGFWWNLVWMKYSRSLTSVVVFRPDPSRGGSRVGQK